MATRTVFTRSAVALMKRMKRDGKTSTEIARALGGTATAASVRNYLSRTKAHRGRTSDGYLSSYVGRDIEQRYHDEARKRRVGVSALVRDVLKKTATDDLFTAVLD